MSDWLDAGGHTQEKRMELQEAYRQVAAVLSLAQQLHHRLDSSTAGASLTQMICRDLDALLRSIEASLGVPVADINDNAARAARHQLLISTGLVKERRVWAKERRKAR